MHPGVRLRTVIQICFCSTVNFAQGLWTRTSYVRVQRNPKLLLLLPSAKHAGRPEVAHDADVFPVEDRIHLPDLRQ